MFAKIKEDTIQIKNLEELLSKNHRVKVVSHEVKPLTEFGTNFGSEILKVDITVEENGRENVLHTVAKTTPPTQFQREIIQTQDTFKYEIGFYAEIVPTVQEFQREHGVPPAEYFPTLLGARINLKSDSDVLDDDAVILMDNLKLAGFGNIEHQDKGFNLSSAKVILSTLAAFQATVLAIRKKKPELFQAKILPYLHEWKAPDHPVEIESILNENPATAPLIPKIKKILAKKRFKKIREPWATITHNDLWVNNIMVKETDDGIDAVKLVDFQMPDYGSPAADLIFFLFTSVQVPVLRYHFEKLLQYYFREFINTLKQFKIDTTEYTYESFQEELKLESSYQLYHSLFVTVRICGVKSQEKPPGKLADRALNGQAHGGIENGHQGPPTQHAGPPGNSDIPKPPGGGAMFKVSLNLKEKMQFIVEEAAKQNWI